MKTSLLAGLLAALLPLTAAAQAPNWRSPDPAETLVIDTTKGRVLVELTPEVAPLHVERVRLLAQADDAQVHVAEYGLSGLHRAHHAVMAPPDTATR